jgi:hypothetical protein
MAKKSDALDFVLERWARTRRQILGLAPMDTDPKDATKGGWCDGREYVGAVRCTLSAVRDHYDGAGAGTAAKQFYPEVYTGESFVVNMAFKNLTPEERQVVDAHYCAFGPVKIKIDVLDLTWNDYWTRLKNAKRSIDGGLKMFKQISDSDV